MREIQDGSQIIGSTNNFAGFTDTRVVQKTIVVYVYVECRQPEISIWPQKPEIITSLENR